MGLESHDQDELRREELRVLADRIPRLEGIPPADLEEASPDGLLRRSIHSLAHAHADILQTLEHSLQKLQDLTMQAQSIAGELQDLLQHTELDGSPTPREMGSHRGNQGGYRSSGPGSQVSPTSGESRWKTKPDARRTSESGSRPGRRKVIRPRKLVGIRSITQVSRNPTVEAPRNPTPQGLEPPEQSPNTAPAGTTSSISHLHPEPMGHAMPVLDLWHASQTLQHQQEKLARGLAENLDGLREQLIKMREMSRQCRSIRSVEPLSEPQVSDH